MRGRHRLWTLPAHAAGDHRGRRAAGNQRVALATTAGEMGQRLRIGLTAQQ